ncbi:hypothetical protein HWQ46_09725 [Shewanella sp. D64]|uniref:hypothetical protein n=1 Tax=unclassified Shewanella TaxID=196818 RepID=UPI0022BA530B|nr:MULTISPECIES: hypothetical protein [unclassified Shewanella]MEC4725821.1 hypothetical protein [Shewanella sp. D64]MEC4737572.1 hypothetical protein [Shewanella sp. E94]WBJ93390.1 hypothetical protein HWQ47_15760 [Shewanella sp. MTB7]
MAFQQQTFLRNNYLLVYGNDDGLSFRFDNIVSMQADLGVGLYTEGTGNLAYVKGATNPVKMIFSKTLEMGGGKDDTEHKPFIGRRRFSVKNKSIGDITIVKSYKDPSPLTHEDGTNKTVSPEETSIFQWAETINGGTTVDKFDLTVYALLDEEDGMDNKKGKYKQASRFVNFIELKGAIPILANIKRNPYRGKNKAELTFVADGITTHRIAQFNVDIPGEI